MSEWYSESCPCDINVGQCGEHPRARIDQRPPSVPWRVWLLTGKRGAGKTRAAVEYVNHSIGTGAVSRAVLIGPDYGFARSQMVEGPAGILRMAAVEARPVFVLSQSMVRWPGGAKAWISGSDNRVAGLRGETLIWGDNTDFWGGGDYAWQAIDHLYRNSGCRIVLCGDAEPISPSGPWTSYLEMSEAFDRTGVFRSDLCMMDNAVHLDPDWSRNMSRRLPEDSSSSPSDSWRHRPSLL